MGNEFAEFCVGHVFQAVGAGVVDGKADEEGGKDCAEVEEGSFHMSSDAFSGLITDWTDREPQHSYVRIIIFHSGACGAH